MEQKESTAKLCVSAERYQHRSVGWRAGWGVGSSESMTALSGECAEASHSFFPGRAVSPRWRAACRSIRSQHEELLTLLLLSGASPGIKIYLGYKIRVVSIGTAVALSENHLNAHFSGSCYGNLDLHTAFPWKPPVHSHPLLPRLLTLCGIVEKATWE